MNENLTVAEALRHAFMIDANLDALASTAPKSVAAMGGRDALAERCEMTCIGPVLRIDADTWERMSMEYEDRRLDGSR